MIPGIDYIGVTVAFYCNDGKGNFVFHKRSKLARDEQGRWDPGGGQVEFGESLEEAVLREIAEEYGCQGEIQEELDAHSVIRIQNDKKTHWLCIPFFVKVNPQEVKNNYPKKIDEIGWFTLDTLPTPIHSGFESTYKRYKKRFEKYR